MFWNRQLYDRWPLVVKLSDRITVEPVVSKNTNEIKNLHQPERFG